MLRRQNPNPDPMSFLAGNSEMAQRIRSFDWAGHPLGSPQAWPQSLRSALGICLNAEFPTAIYWGSELRLLYNDAWSAIPGPRHPDCLGARAADVWSDIWHVIEPQFTHLIETGEGILVEDQLLPMRRYGFEEETYWNYSFTPIRGEDGKIEGVFNAGNETTDKVFQRRQTELLLSVSDILRTTSGTEQIMHAACELIGKHLGAHRVGLRELAQGPAADSFPISAEWTAEGVAPVGNMLPFADLGVLGQTLTEGHVVRIEATDNLEDPALRTRFAALDAAALLAVPWTEERDLQAVLFMHAPQARRWSDDNVATVEKVLDRVMGAIGRERARAREKVMMREIDHRARNLLAVVRALVRITDGRDVPHYRQKLVSCLEALSKTHTLLAAERWSGVSLDSLLEAELAPYNGEGARKATFRGPRIMLEAELAQTLAMVFHELATNAAKHGALADQNGSIEIGWDHTTDDDLLTIRWTETSARNGAAIVPTESTGFGSDMLNQVVEQQLGGEIHRDLSTGNLDCTIRIALHPSRRARKPLAVPDAADGPPQNTATGTRILVVEDDPIVAMDLTDTLGTMGYTVMATAHDVQSALSALNCSTPDLAVIDINLGHETSEPVAEVLIERGIPFLLSTGYDSEGAPESVFTGLPRITQPFSEPDLKAKLEGLNPGCA